MTSIRSATLVRTFPLRFTAARTPVLGCVSALPRSGLPLSVQQPSLLPAASSSAAAFQVAGFSSSAAAKAGDSHYDPPSGWLWGIPPGEKREPEGWERIWVWGFWGSLAVAAVAYAYKPDTSIQTWALEEARRRLEAEGILPDPESNDSE